MATRKLITPLNPEIYTGERAIFMGNIQLDQLIKLDKLGRYQEMTLDISLSAFEVFKRLYPDCENIFLLESLGEDGKYNRYSYIGFDPLFVISAKNNQIMIKNKVHRVGNPYAVLSALSTFFDKKAIGRSLPAGRQGYIGGLVGYFSHEATKYFEKAYAGYENHDFPDFEFGFFIDGLRFDKKTKKCTYFCYGKSRIEKIMKLINHSGKLDSFIFKNIQSNKSEKEHKQMVLAAKKYIMAGNIFQSVLSIKTIYKILGDKRRLYAVLRQINPSPYMIYFKFGQREVITASPELLIRVKGREIEHFGTLAGTIRKGSSSREDEELAEKLKKDKKEMAEHMMLVDLARNDMGKICEFGSIKVDKLATVKKYSHVQHLYSEIRGRLGVKENAFSALAACFPAGTLTGAPKIEAMKIISKLEGESRGPYGGVGGYFSMNGDCMLAITIRSIFINGEQAYTQTGSGIVLDSKPSKEYEEILNKQKAMEEALREAQG